MTRDPAEFGWHCWSNTVHPPPSSTTYVASWKTGEDGLCCSSSAIQTRLGPSSLLEKRSEIPIIFVVCPSNNKSRLDCSAKTGSCLSEDMLLYHKKFISYELEKLLFDNSILWLGLFSKNRGSSWHRIGVSPAQSHHPQPWATYDNQEFPARSMNLSGMTLEQIRLRTFSSPWVDSSQNF